MGGPVQRPPQSLITKADHNSIRRARFECEVDVNSGVWQEFDVEAIRFP